MAYKDKPGITNVSSEGTVTKTRKAQVEILGADTKMYQIVVEEVDVPTLPPTRYAIVEFHTPDGAVKILERIFLGGVQEGVSY